MTVEAHRDVERRRKEYVAYYGDFPYNPETYWRQIEEAESSECETEDGDGDGSDAKEGESVQSNADDIPLGPIALDDETILKAM